MLYIAVVPMATVGVKGLISVIYNSCIRLPSSVSQKRPTGLTSAKSCAVVAEGTS